VAVAGTEQTLPLVDAAEGCPVCGVDHVVPLHVYRNKRRIGSSEYLTLTGCPACGIAWAHPLPEERELDAWYGSDEGWERRPGLREQAAGGSEGEAALKRKLDAKRPGRERETDLLLPLLTDLPPRDEGAAPAVLDFGCGLGAWLDVFAARGWDTAGIEPGPTARAAAGSRHRMLDAPPAGPEFDLVIVHHVFEHLRDPLGHARSLSAALKPGGWAIVSVPGFDRLPLHMKFGYVSSDVHLFSYTFEGMRRMLAYAGLRVVRQLEGGGWDEGSQGGSHLKVLARREPGMAPIEGGDPLAPARAALRAWGALRRAVLEARPPEAPWWTRVSPGRQKRYRARRVKHARALSEPLDMPLLDLPARCPCCDGESLKPLRVLPDSIEQAPSNDHVVLVGCRRCGVTFRHPPPPAASHRDELHQVQTASSEPQGRVLELLGEQPSATAGRRAVLLAREPGAWLDALAEAGWDADQIEPGAEPRLAPPYDAAILDAVLESLPDPSGMLRGLRAVAAPWARLYVTAPMLDPFARDARSFTPESLRAVLGLAGWAAGEPRGQDGEAAINGRSSPLRMVATASTPTEPMGSKPLLAAEAALRDAPATPASVPRT
jgi:SAM-dependent methyltransferase